MDNQTDNQAHPDKPAAQGGGRWWQQGKPPDYRFSLANERTFLAWIRTALAFLAGAVGISQFAPGLGTHQVRAGLAVLLSVMAASLGIMAYRRWAASELAMRTGASLPHTPLLLMMALFVAAVALALTALILLS
ncbi:YidH family protein [Acerihabitans sp.]|uniref:YidH family protein n=1 Tax=Acerihabitans sp. TaxID=2811394 RepID=UPI002EDA2480